MEFKTLVMDIKGKMYNKSFKAVSLSIIEKPKGIKEWFWAIYGLDIFIQGFPMCKLLVLGNIIYWSLK